MSTFSVLRSQSRAISTRRISLLLWEDTRESWKRAAAATAHHPLPHQSHSGANSYQKRFRHDGLPRIRLIQDSSIRSLACTDQHMQQLHIRPSHSLVGLDQTVWWGPMFPTKQQRFASTTTPTTNDGSPNSETSADSHSNQEVDDNNDKDSNNDKKPTWRHRAADIRDNARESIQEFRENPRESMKSGAKTFSGMMKAYGPVFIGCHLAVYCVTLAGLYGGVESGLLDPIYLMSLIGNGSEDGAVESTNTVAFVVEWMKNHSWSAGMAPFIERNPHYASFAVAWIAAKFTEPIRLPISAFLTPQIARYLGRKPSAD